LNGSVALNVYTLYSENVSTALSLAFNG